MNLYELFISGVNIKYIVFSILYWHINVPMACKELVTMLLNLSRVQSARTHTHSRKNYVEGVALLTHELLFNV